MFFMKLIASPNHESVFINIEQLLTIKTNKDGLTELVFSCPGPEELYRITVFEDCFEIIERINESKNGAVEARTVLATQ